MAHWQPLCIAKTLMGMGMQDLLELQRLGGKVTPEQLDRLQGRGCRLNASAVLGVQSNLNGHPISAKDAYAAWRYVILTPLCCCFCCCCLRMCLHSDFNFMTIAVVKVN